MKRVFALAIVLTAAGAMAESSNAIASTTPSDHPLIGKWEWTRSSNACREVFEFRADGTVPVTSGAERTENAFTVVEEAELAEFYRVTIRTMKDYGGKDCGDDDSDSTGLVTVSYVVFNPSRTEYLACANVKLENCFGPLRRVDDR